MNVGEKYNQGLLKKAGGSVLPSFPCLRIEGTFRTQKWLRPCWMNFFEQAQIPWWQK